MNTVASRVKKGKTAVKPANETTKIVVVDNHLMVREGLCALVDKQPDMEVSAQVREGADVVQVVLELMPEVIIMDIHLPEFNGSDATREIIAGHPTAKVIGLSLSFDEYSITSMLQAGASGYLLMESPFEELINAIHSVTDDKMYFGPEKVNFIARKYFDHLFNEQMSFDPNLLSNREREVLQHIAAGDNTKEIAFTLHISPKTVETYRKNLVSKLNINSTALLTKYAIRQGLSYL